MTVIIDRFEGAFAVVELPDGSMANLPASLVPGAGEGDAVRIEIDGGETEARRKRIEEKAKRLWAD